MWVTAGRQSVGNAGACRLFVEPCCCQMISAFSPRGSDTANVVRSCNHCCCGKAINITYSECVFVALGTEHAMHMRHIAICGLTHSTVFSTLSHKRNDLPKNVVEHKLCVFTSSTTLSETFFILRRFERAVISAVWRSSCKVFVILVRF